MKNIFCLIAFVLGSTALLSADEGKSVPYTVTVKGVVCGSCKMHVTEAFKKLPGVEQVSFTKGETADTQKVTFNASSDELHKEDAVKALGDASKRYEVVTLEKTP